MILTFLVQSLIIVRWVYRNDSDEFSVRREITQEKKVCEVLNLVLFIKFFLNYLFIFIVDKISMNYSEQRFRLLA